VKLRRGGRGRKKSFPIVKKLDFSRKKEKGEKKPGGRHQKECIEEKKGGPRENVPFNRKGKKKGGG